MEFVVWTPILIHLKPCPHNTTRNITIFFKKFIKEKKKKKKNHWKYSSAKLSFKILVFEHYKESLIFVVQFLLCEPPTYTSQILPTPYHKQSIAIFVTRKTQSWYPFNDELGFEFGYSSITWTTWLNFVVCNFLFFSRNLQLMHLKP